VKYPLKHNLRLQHRPENDFNVRYAGD